LALPPSLDIATLQSSYRSGNLSPQDVVEQLYQRISAHAENPIWITLLPEAEVYQTIATLEERRNTQGLDRLPLFGIPFAVKDNIDVAGLPTTAACPDFSYVPRYSATVVERLQQAGAVLIGKTNLDQFATGLVGTRSPYGACRNAFNPSYISGGSSSGSAVAVALGLVSFALGTDTAGSGRVPAAFNNLVGLKPTRGRLSTQGIVPACRSLDCVSIFALTCRDARLILDLTQGFDLDDPYSRHLPSAVPVPGRTFRFGIPTEAQLEFFGDREAPALFEQSIEHLISIGGIPTEIEFAPFRAAAQLLYAGPWIAERYSAVKDFLNRKPDKVLPVIGQVLSNAQRYTAWDVFSGMHHLEQFRQLAALEWQKMDCLITPTTGTIYEIAAVNADPIQLNANLGYYTNFMNLLDLCAIALPGGFRSNGLPFGITLVGPAFRDHWLCQLGDRYHQQQGSTLGALGIPLAAVEPAPTFCDRPNQLQYYTASSATSNAGETIPDLSASSTPVNMTSSEPDSTNLAPTIKVAVLGAHLSGMPLNFQLRDRGGRLIEATETAPLYQFYALAGTQPPKPGLVRINPTEAQGYAIAVEVWSLPQSEFGSFVAEIPPPLGIGTLTLASGEQVKGFICEPYGLEGATNISEHGGWRAYMASLAST